MIVAGFGCRKGCSAAAILAVARLAAERAGIDLTAITLLCAPAFKQAETGLGLAAAELGLPLVLIPDAQMAAVQERVSTHSEKVALLTGFGSIAEAAALAGAGDTARLITPRVSLEGATCAIARS